MSATKLKRNGRPLVPKFKKDEALFLRFRHMHFVNGKVIPDAIDLPAQSVNRGSLSEGSDILLNLERPDLPPDIYKKWGIAHFTANLIPLKHDTVLDATLLLEHLPTENNYSHSEIRLYKSKVFDADKKPGEQSCPKGTSSAARIEYRCG